MNIKKIIGLAGGLLTVVSFIPILPDPINHEEKICFWAWIYKKVSSNRKPKYEDSSMPQTSYGAQTFGRPSE